MQPQVTGELGEARRSGSRLRPSTSKPAQEGRTRSARPAAEARLHGDRATSCPLPAASTSSGRMADVAGAGSVSGGKTELLISRGASGF